MEFVIRELVRSRLVVWEARLLMAYKLLFLALVVPVPTQFINTEDLLALSSPFSSKMNADFDIGGASVAELIVCMLADQASIKYCDQFYALRCQSMLEVLGIEYKREEGKPPNVYLNFDRADNRHFKHIMKVMKPIIELSNLNNKDDPFHFRVFRQPIQLAISSLAKLRRDFVLMGMAFLLFKDDSPKWISFVESIPNNLTSIDILYEWLLKKSKRKTIIDEGILQEFLLLKFLTGRCKSPESMFEAFNAYLEEYFISHHPREYEGFKNYPFEILHIAPKIDLD